MSHYIIILGKHFQTVLYTHRFKIIGAHQVQAIFPFQRRMPRNFFQFLLKVDRCKIIGPLHKTVVHYKNRNKEVKNLLLHRLCCEQRNNFVRHTFERVTDNSLHHISPYIRHGILKIGNREVTPFCTPQVQECPANSISNQELENSQSASED